MGSHSTARPRWLRPVGFALFTVLAGTALASCASNPDAATSETAGAVEPARLAESGCGSLPGEVPADPDGVLQTLPEQLQTAYQGFGEELQASAWAGGEPTPGPWKIGLSLLPDTNSVNHAYLTEFQKRFDEAKEAGLVEGDLIVNLMTEFNPAQQLQLYQSLVDQGVDGIVIQAMSGPSMASAVDAAGAAGIVTASFGALPSVYSVSSQASFYQDVGSAAAATLGQLPDGTGNVLIVNGLEGLDPQVKGRAAIDAALAECPDVTVIGEVSAAFTDPTAKEAVQTFLASYPGQIDAVLQMGAMATGTISAFQQVGRDVPLVTMNGATAGALSYWADNADTYSPAGTVGAYEHQADAVWDALIRTLAGGEPKSNYLVLPSVLVTSANVGELVEEGTDYSSDAPPLPTIPYVTNEVFDEYFFAPETNPLG